jgi:D-alanine-D-alanine ligase
MRKMTVEPAKKLRVGVLFGGRSGEHEVSLRSARSVLGALDANKYDVTQIGITHAGLWLVGDNVLESMFAGKTDQLLPVTMLPDPTHPGLYSFQAGAERIGLQRNLALDLIFPLVHGTFGEDGTLQGLLEMADIAYVGSGVLGSSVGMDKALFKDVMRANRIPVVDSMTYLRRDVERDINAIISAAEKRFSYPVFTKPVNLGSSVGISKCRSRADLLEGLMDAARYDRRVLVEQGVNGREIEVSVLGNDDPQASLPGEIVPAADFYTYDAKYHDDRSELHIPALLSAAQTAEVRALAVSAFKAADCAGMARVDFLLDRDSGRFYVNELNTLPGFTEISMYPKLWVASGMTYPQLVDRLIELGLERKAERDRTERRYYRQGEVGHD